MKIFMYIPGMKFDGNTIKEGKSLGGSETSGYYIAQGLAAKGHSMFMFCSTDEARNIDGIQYLPIGARTERTPFGERFQQIARTIPHDVLIAQRVPGIFSQNYYSKMNLWWVHDIVLKRNQNYVNSMLWNTDKIFGVSNWHKNQIEQTYGVDIVGVLPNGVNFTDYAGQLDIERKLRSKIMIYSHRPERGLINLVKPGGIMEKLQDPELKLIVCGYDHSVPEMMQFYGEIDQMIQRLPNVENIGHIGKQQLAVIQKNAWLQVYPTEFEETSCITAMEVQAAGTPIITTKTAALPETLKDGGVVWSRIEDFTKKINKLLKNPEHWKQLHEKALKKVYDYGQIVDEFEKEIYSIFEKKTQDKTQLYNHYIKYSDIIAASKIDKVPDYRMINDAKGIYEEEELEENTPEKAEKLMRMPRVQPVLKQLETLPAGSTVFEYGCGVGHMTRVFETAFPDLIFYGGDISERKCKRAEELGYDCKWMDWPTEGQYDCVIVMEVLEHIADIRAFMSDIEKMAKPGGKIIYSTPLGLTDYLNIEEKKHLHHLEEQDIMNLAGKKPKFEMFYAMASEQWGSFIWSYEADQKEIGKIDYDRKDLVQKPDQTVSVCMIVKPDGDKLAATLKSIQPIADEIIMGIDGEGGRAKEIAEEFGAKTFPIDSPVETGFDFARNETIKKATKDWILWIDDDETLKWPERLRVLLRDNQFDSYAICHHHFTIDPFPALMKTDHPSRLFRNKKGIKFFGVVHEHPETKINNGAGKTYMVPHEYGNICHGGYDTESTRRKRFERNWPLMQRDREKYKDRKLGKFLWIRDLAHINRFELEQAQANQLNFDRAKEAIEMWRGLLKSGDLRMVTDSLPYVTESVNLLTHGRGYTFKLASQLSYGGYGDNINGEVPPFIEGKVEKEEDYRSLIDLIASEKTGQLELKYI